MNNVLGRVKGLFKKSPKPRKLPPGAYPNNERNPAAPRTGANNERNPAAAPANNERNPAAPRTGATNERNPPAPANERNPPAPVNERNPPAPANERNPAAGGAAPVNQRNPPATGTITKPEPSTDDDDDDDIDDPTTLTNYNTPGQPPQRDPQMNPAQTYQGIQSENGYESNPPPPNGPPRGAPPGFPPGFGATNPGMNNPNPPANNSNNPRGGPSTAQPLPGMPFFSPGQNPPARGPNPPAGNNPPGPPPLPPPINVPGNSNPSQGGLSGLPSFFRNLNGNPAAAQSGNNSPAQPRPGFPPLGNAGNRTQTPQQNSWPARTSSMRNGRRDDDTDSRIELDYPIENVLIDANIPAAIAVKINDVVERDRQGNSYHVHRYTYEPPSQQFSVDHHQPGRSHSREQSHRSGIRHIREIHHNDQNPVYNDLPPYATPARSHRHRSFSDMPLQDYVDQLVRTPGSVVVHAKDADDLRRLVNQYLANDYVPPTAPQMMPPTAASPRPLISSSMPPRHTPLPTNCAANERIVYYTAQALPHDPMRVY